MRAQQDLPLFISITLALFASVATAQESVESDSPEPNLDQVVPVAEEDASASEEHTVPEVEEASDEELLMLEFQRYKELVEDSVFDEADSVAKRVVELSIRVSGPRSNDTARALTNLAIVQHRTAQYDAAQQNFQTAVDIIEDNEDRLNGQLVNPLKGLGAAQLEGGRPDLASTTFARAVHVTHVNEGPHNLDQVSILESLAEANLRLGTVDDAKQIHEMIFALNVRAHADDTLGLVPSLMRRAAWQHRAGFIFDERATYRRIIRIIEENVGKDDLQLVEPLIKLGQSYFYVDLSGSQTYQQSSMTTGEIYFKRAVRIAEDDPESSWELVASTTLALGDYYMFEGSEQRARKVYQDVWDLLSPEEERLDFRRDNLEQLVALRERPIPQYVTGLEGAGGGPLDEAVLQGRISVSYVISSRGRAGDIKIIEAEPAEFEEMQRNVHRELRSRVFRPQFDDSGPTESAEQILTHRFYYRQADLDALRGAAAAAEQSDEG